MAKKKGELDNPFESGEEEKPEEPKRADEGAGEVEVELKPKREPDDEDDEGGDEPDAAARASRKERRRQRLDDLLASEKAERERLAREVEELRQRQAQPQYQQQPQQDPYEPELQRRYTRKREIANEFATLQRARQLTPEMENRYWAESEQLEDEIAQLRYMRVQANDPRNSPQARQNEAIGTWLKTQHPDVVSHPRRDHVVLAARGYYATLVAQGAAPDTFETYNKAVERAKADFGIAKRPPPSEAQRARYTGLGRGSSNGSDGPTRVVLSPEEQKMAWARFKGTPGINSEKDAYKAYAEMRQRRAKKAGDEKTA